MLHIFGMLPSYDISNQTIMDKVVVYIHGKGGNAEESERYKTLLCNCNVVGLDYIAQFSWKIKEEFSLQFDRICAAMGYIDHCDEKWRVLVPHGGANEVSRWVVYDTK